MFVDFWIRLHNEAVFSLLVFSWMRSWLDDVCLVGFWLDDDACLVGFWLNDGVGLCLLVSWLYEVVFSPDHKLSQ